MQDSINKLLEIVKRLRAPGGCPWDIEQTHSSCSSGLIEEAYEAVDAIEREDFSLLKEELGDVLLQVIFHSQIAEESGKFNFNDVCNEISNKLVIRHPHVFGDTTVSNTDEVLSNWDKNKKETKNQSYTDTLNDVPRSFPALMRAQKIGKRAAKANLDFYSIDTALFSLESEISELKTAISDNTNLEEELGDVLFSVTNVARFANINAENALKVSTDKFIKRFKFIEDTATFSGKKMDELTLEELNILWEKSKNCL